MVRPKGTSSSEQGPTDPVVSPPREQPGGKAKFGNKKAMGHKGGTCRQRGTQKGGKKGYKSSSSSRDGDVKREGSASTVPVVPKFRCVRPR